MRACDFKFKGCCSADQGQVILKVDSTAGWLCCTYPSGFVATWHLSAVFEGVADRPLRPARSSSAADDARVGGGVGGDGGFISVDGGASGGGGGSSSGNSSSEDEDAAASMPPTMVFELQHNGLRLCPHDMAICGSRILVTTIEHPEQVAVIETAGWERRVRRNRRRIRSSSSCCSTFSLDSSFGAGGAAMMDDLAAATAATASSRAPSLDTGDGSGGGTSAGGDHSHFYGDVWNMFDTVVASHKHVAFVPVLPEPRPRLPPSDTADTADTAAATGGGGGIGGAESDDSGDSGDSGVDIVPGGGGGSLGICTVGDAVLLARPGGGMLRWPVTAL